MQCLQLHPISSLNSFYQKPYSDIALGKDLSSTSNSDTEISSKQHIINQTKHWEFFKLYVFSKMYTFL